jgi:hypothetical protein
VINVGPIVVKPRDLKTSVPFYTDVAWTILGDSDILNECHDGILLTPDDTLPTPELATHFQFLLLELNVDNTLGRCTTTGNAGVPAYSTLYGSDGYIITDDITDEVKNGKKYLYVLMSWRYQLSGGSTVYLRQVCAYAQGQFSPWHNCSDFNGTSVYKEQW